MKGIKGVTGEGIFWTVVVCCITLVVVAIVLGGKGCNVAATVKCNDGTTLTREAFAEDPDLSLGDAEKFCEGHNGVGSYSE